MSATEFTHEPLKQQNTRELPRTRKMSSLESLQEPQIPQRLDRTIEALSEPCCLVVICFFS